MLNFLHSVSAHLPLIGLVVAVVHAAALHSFLSRFVPPKVREWLTNPVVGHILLQVEQQSGLDDVAKRSAAARDIQAFLASHGVTLKDSEMNALIEGGLSALKKAGLA